MARITLSASKISPSRVLTPVTEKFSVSISSASAVSIFTPLLFTALTSASTISDALSDTGKTLFPRSVLSGTPRFSKNSIVSAVPKSENAEKRNLPFAGTFEISVSRSQLFVTLHLPFPVIISFLPGRRFFSITVTALPPYFSAAAQAAISPAAPPPIITVFFIFSPLINNYLLFYTNSVKK